MQEVDQFARGAAGERRVAEVLEQLRPSLGYALIHDVLLDFNGQTTQIDHVLIDRFGMLVIETKAYGATLKGRSDEHNWTAIYRSGQQRQMYNPLMQNDGHRKWLSKLLFQYGLASSPNYIQSLIVFAKGEIAELTLTEVDTMRVVTTDKLAAFVCSRSDFPPNDGRLGEAARHELYHFITVMNRRGDPGVEARHLAAAKAARSGGRRNRGRRSHTPAARHEPRIMTQNSQTDQGTYDFAVVFAVVAVLAALALCGLGAVVLS